MPASLALLIELQRPVQIAVIGERQRVHAQLFGPLDQLLDRAGAIEQAVMAVAMQMNKRRRGHGDSFPKICALRLVILPLRASTRHDPAPVESGPKNGIFQALK